MYRTGGLSPYQKNLKTGPSGDLPGPSVERRQAVRA